MLGRAVVSAAPDGVECIGVTRADGDLATPDGVRSAIIDNKPQLVIHCAARTDVDGCERVPSRAWHDNAQATRLVAEACRSLGARMIYVSTDYVFDGTKGSPYTEADPPCPINVYGETKLAGEAACLSLGASGLVIRTQWLFGEGGRNFVDAILAQAERGQALRVVKDQWGAPTWTQDLALAIWLLAEKAASGIVHVTSSGTANFFEVARVILDAAGISVPVEAISSEQWPSPVRRPRFAALDCTRFEQIAGAPMRPWQEAVREYVATRLGGQT